MGVQGAFRSVATPVAPAALVAALVAPPAVSVAQSKVIHRTAAVTQTRRPAGWLANQTNVDDGVTADGKRKKLPARPLTATSLPPDGAPLGNYGFSWGNAVYGWRAAANGGEAVTTIITPATSSF